MRIIKLRQQVQERGWTIADVIVSMAVIFGLIFVLIWMINPLVRYKETRNARRQMEVYSVVHAILERETDDQARYLGERNFTIDNDETTAQIIVRNPENATCRRGLPTTPICPGASAVNLNLPQADGGCIVMLDDAKYNNVGLVNHYLLALPIDPGVYDQRVFVPTIGGPLGANNTGYYINRYKNGSIEVGACHPELGKLVREVR